MADYPSKIYGKTNVSLSLNGGLHQLGPDLEEKELAAIGWVTAHWAMLEHYLLYQSLEMATARGTEPNPDFINLSFARRFKAWLTEVRHLPDNQRKSELEKLSGKITNCENRRHQTTHGLWAWEIGDPEKLRTFSTRPKVEFDGRIDLDGLAKLAQEIGEINFVLVYPNGKEDVYKQRLEATGSISRCFLKAISPNKD